MAGDERAQQVVIAVATAARMASGILMGTALAVYVGERGTPFAVSMVLAAYFLGLTVFAPVWGAIADVTGRRRAVLVLTGILATAAIVPLAFTDGVWLPIGLRWLYAVFAAGYPPVMLSIMSVRGGDAGRGRSIGFYNSARASGFTAGQLAAGALLGALAPAGVAAAIALASLASTLAAVLVFDPTPAPEEPPTLAELAGEIRRRLLPAREDRAHLQDHGLGWLYVALAIRNMTVLGVSSLTAPYLLSNVGVTTAVMGLVLAINPAGQTVFMYLFGRVADTAGRKPLIVAGMVGSGAYALLMASATLPATVPVRALVAGGALVVLGAGYSAMTTGALAFIGDVVPAVREGEMMGLRSTAKGVGGVLGPPLIGSVATYTSYETAFALASLLAVAAAGLAAASLTESRPADAGSRVSPGD
jgi:MFS family permease